MYYDFQKIGEKLWERFNAPKEKIAWYYGGIVDALSALEDYDMYQELKETVQKMFG